MVKAVQAEPGLALRQRILKAIDKLGTGQEDVAKAELNAYLSVSPKSQIARHLLKQITTPANQFYPSEYFTVELAYGQSISTLAEHYLGKSLEFYALAKYNQIENPGHINTGSKIKIPLTPYAISVRDNEAKSVQTTPAEKPDNDPSAQSQQAVLAQNDTANEPAAEPAAPLPETPAELKAQLTDATNNEDFASALTLLRKIQNTGIENDTDLQRLTLQTLIGSAGAVRNTNPASASALFAEAGDIMQQKNKPILAFDYYKMAVETDSSNDSAQHTMISLQQQIVDKYHREASIAFRQQRIEEAIEKWDVVLHVDPSNTNVSAYRIQALELQERLQAIETN